MQQKIIKIFFWSILFFGFFGMAENIQAATIFVDNTLVSNCNNSYSVVNRTCAGGNSDAYNTIQEAINNCAVGDVIEMRGGAYREIDIDIPESKNGTAWTTGNFTTLSSYPGEWAIIDATGLTGSNSWKNSVIKHNENYGVTNRTELTRYWKFERFEITGGRVGIFLKIGPIWARYLYIHDNGLTQGDEIQGGIVIVASEESIIEYCRLEDNTYTGATSNNSQIIFDTDYRDTAGAGNSFDPTLGVWKNIVRYNYISGGHVGFRHKSQQRFGYNDRNPDPVNGDMTDYIEWGDKIHHNIIENVSNSGIIVDQDYAQVYNNISAGTISSGFNYGGMPIVYGASIYNNTTKGVGGNYYVDSGDDDAGYTTMYRYSDELPRNYPTTQYTVHPWVWLLNNISSGTDSASDHWAIQLTGQVVPNSSNPNFDMKDTIVERNLVHNASAAYSVYNGDNSNIDMFPGCLYYRMSVDAFNNCSNSWRAITGVENWDVDGTLFVGSSGADQYVTNEFFEVTSGKFISNAGLGGNHPYLSGVTIPSYIGATNPNDNAWVAGVLGLAYVSNLQNTSGDDPAWIEGFGDSVAPANPTNLSVL